MRSPVKIISAVLLLTVFSLCHEQLALAQKARKKQSPRTPVLWRDPGDISSRDLRYGPGSESLAPAEPFTFIGEVKSGESPKFDVKDARGVVWRVKLGEEAQTETVATRLVWSVGYFVEEAYYLERAGIDGLRRLSRGREFVEGQTARGARFEPRRKGVKRGPEWDWDKNPFKETRELNGLKVLMILLNNYDARKENNRIVYVSPPGGGRAEAQYVVTDMGATLGKSGGLGGKRTKNNLEGFLSTRFVMGIEDDGSVKFDYDTRPNKFGMFTIF